jgi:hypothetical protein
MLLLALVLESCYEEQTIVYRIPKGEHESLPRQFQTIDKNPLVFYAKFDKSAVYPNSTHDSEDINKLFGFADCNSTVHDDSARFGWRCSNDSIELFAYTYCNGVRDFVRLGTADLDKWIRCEIRINKGYEFILNGVTTIMKRGNNCDRGVYYQLQPYFGGNEVAPHDITISIKQY